MRVVLLHGILNPRWVMLPLARRLNKEGFNATLWSYPGSRKPVEAHAANLAAHLKTLPGQGPVHFVGFSLGSLVIRYMLSNFPLDNAGRFVMIGPPNHGSAKAEALYQSALFRWIYGKHSIRQLFPSAVDFYARCGIPPVEFGIIAGEHDEAVSVASARLEGAKDFVLSPHTHMSLIWARHTADQTVHFLKNGKFQ
jgi:pimeloyl-ACP methyl ester carboxylesterase